MGFITGAYGLTQYGNFVQTKVDLVNQYGPLSPSLSSTTLIAHLRSGKSSNRRQPLLNSTTLWIPPSSYTRYQRQYYPLRSGLSKTPGGKMVTEQPLYQDWLTYGYSKGNFDKVTSGLYGSIAVTGSLNTSHPDVRNALHMVEVKALNDISGAKAQLGEFLATATKTADMFLDSSLAIGKLALAVKNGNLARVGKFYSRVIRSLNVKQLRNLTKQGKIPSRVSSAWLQFWYGWKPLVQDTYGLYELLTEQLKPAQLVHGRGQTKLVGNHSWTVGRLGYRPGLEMEEFSLVQLRCNLTARLDSPKGLRGLNTAGLLNPAALAWELIPFSFVVDWFTPIGPVLQSLSATTGLTFVGGHVTYKASQTVNATVSVADGTPPAKAMSTLTGFDRVKLGSFPFPVPYSRPFYTGADRIATISALLVSLFK